MKQICLSRLAEDCSHTHANIYNNNSTHTYLCLYKGKVKTSRQSVWCLWISVHEWMYVYVYILSIYIYEYVCVSRILNGILACHQHFLAPFFFSTLAHFPITSVQPCSRCLLPTSAATAFSYIFINLFLLYLYFLGASQASSAIDSVWRRCAAKLRNFGFTVLLSKVFTKWFVAYTVIVVIAIVDVKVKINTKPQHFNAQFIFIEFSTMRRRHIHRTHVCVCRGILMCVCMLYAKCGGT